MNAISRHLVIALACLAGAAAQATETAGSSFRILFLNPPKDAPKSLYLFDGTACQEVQVPGMSLSPVYHINSGALKLHLLSEKIEDSSAVPLKAPSVNLPANGRDFYLILTGDPQNPIVPVAVQAFHPTPELRKGQLFWINLTDKSIEGRLGEQLLGLEPNSSQILDAPASKAGAYPVALTYRTPGDDSPAQSLSQTQWLHDPDSRQLVVVFTNGENEAPRAIAFADFRAQKSTNPPEN